MNFDFTEKEKTFFDGLQQDMAAFVQANNPDQRRSEAADQAIREGLTQLGENDYLKLGLESVQPDFGSSLTLMRAMEILSGFSPSLFLSVAMSTHLFGKIVDRWGTQEQKESILPGLKTGEILGAVAFSEQSMNVDNDPLRTMGEIVDGKVVINGSKNYVVNAPVADLIAVIGRAQGREVLFLVKKDTPGMAIGKRIDTLGYEGTAIAGIEFSSCAIASGDMIDDFKGDDLAEMLRLWENQILLGASLGMMKSSLETAKDYADNHNTGGKPIKAYQEVAFKLAEMLTLYQTSQLLAYRAAWTGGIDFRSCASLTLCAKVFCTESAETVASQALQVLSGQGYLSGNCAERAFRCSKYGQIAGTSTEIARVKIGDEALGYRRPPRPA